MYLTNKTLVTPADSSAASRTLRPSGYDQPFGNRSLRK
jgi:hypothetical protein